MNIGKYYLDIIAKIACTGLSIVFLLSCVGKLIHFSDTVSYFLEFSFMIPLGSLFVSSVLIAMEFTLGIALILERNPTVPLSASSGMLLIFTMYQIIIMLFPETFTRTCPCFGASEAAGDVDILPTIRNMILLVVSLACYCFYKNKAVPNKGTAHAGVNNE